MQIILLVLLITALEIDSRQQQELEEDILNKELFKRNILKTSTQPEVPKQNFNNIFQNSKNIIKNAGEYSNTNNLLNASLGHPVNSKRYARNLKRKHETGKVSDEDLFDPVSLRNNENKKIQKYSIHKIKTSSHRKRSLKFRNAKLRKHQAPYHSRKSRSEGTLSQTISPDAVIDQLLDLLEPSEKSKTSGTANVTEDSKQSLTQLAHPKEIETSEDIGYDVSPSIEENILSNERVATFTSVNKDKMLKKDTKEKLQNQQRSSNVDQKENISTETKPNLSSENKIRGNTLKSGKQQNTNIINPYGNGIAPVNLKYTSDNELPIMKSKLNAIGTKSRKEEDPTVAALRLAKIISKEFLKFLTYRLDTIEQKEWSNPKKYDLTAKIEGTSNRKQKDIDSAFPTNIPNNVDFRRPYSNVSNNFGLDEIPFRELISNNTKTPTETTITNLTESTTFPYKAEVEDFKRQMSKMMNDFESKISNKTEHSTGSTVDNLSESTTFEYKEEVEDFKHQILKMINDFEIKINSYPYWNQAQKDEGIAHMRDFLQSKVHEHMDDLVKEAQQKHSHATP